MLKNLFSFLVLGVFFLGTDIQAQTYNSTNNGQNEYSDADLTKKVKEKIGSGTFSKGYDQVNAEVKDGVVTLTGPVATLKDKENVDEAVRNIEGVKGVDSKLTVNQPSQATSKSQEFTQDTYSLNTDDQLNKKIRDKVSRGWLWDSYKTVTLNTTNGVVTLEGNVSSLSDQQKLMTEIQKVEGVKQVKSDLKINDAPQNHKKDFNQDTFKTPEDNKLNQQIRDSVSRGWLWDDYKDVTLNTSNGDVTLEGQIGTTKDQEKLMRDIQKVPGVKTVKSNLRINKP